MYNFIFFPGKRNKEKRDDFHAGDINVKYIRTENIISNPFHVRKNCDGEAVVRLADSIKRYGIIEPLAVRRYTSGKFEIVFGERRLQAARLIDMQSVPCVILENISRCAACELAYAENTIREPLNLNEKAMGVETLVRRFNMNRSRVCENLSIYRNEMNFLMDILHLSAYERELICTSSLTAAHLKPLLKIENTNVRRHLMTVIAEKDISPSGCERFIEEFLSSPAKKERRAKKVMPRPVKKLVLGDIRVFMNSIDHAVEIVRGCGAEIKCDKSETDDGVSYTINVRRGTSKSTEI